MPWSRITAGGCGRCWQLSWHPAGCWCLPGAPAGRHTYTVLWEVLESGKEAFRARYLYRITEGEKLISEEELTGCGYRPSWDVIQRELASAGFTQAEGAERLRDWRLA